VKPEFIYRLGSHIKHLSLVRPADYITGLSFHHEPFGKQYFRFSVVILEKNGFIVRPDADELMTDIFTDEPYIEPNSGMQLSFPEGHISVWYPDKAYWTTWYEADVANKGNQNLSKQLEFFAKAIVQEDTL
jgi:hypothetical protein